MSKGKAGVGLCQVSWRKSQVQGCQGFGEPWAAHRDSGEAVLAEGHAEAWRLMWHELKAHTEHSHQALDGFRALSCTPWETTE